MSNSLELVPQSFMLLRDGHVLFYGPLLDNLAQVQDAIAAV